MKSYIRMTLMLVLVLTMSICLIACEKQKEGKVIVIEKEFNLEKGSKFTYSLNVKGKVKNVGDVDVKNIVIAGRCNTCDEMMISGKWFATQTVRSRDQQDTITYLAKDDEAEFQFMGIAYYYTREGEASQTFPEGLEVMIESLEVAEK